MLRAALAFAATLAAGDTAADDGSIAIDIRSPRPRAVVEDGLSPDISVRLLRRGGAADAVRAAPGDFALCYAAGADSACVALDRAGTPLPRLEHVGATKFVAWVADAEGTRHAARSVPIAARPPTCDGRGAMASGLFLFRSGAYAEAAAAFRAAACADPAAAKRNGDAAARYAEAERRLSAASAFAPTLHIVTTLYRGAYSPARAAELVEAQRANAALARAPARDVTLHVLAEGDVDVAATLGAHERIVAVEPAAWRSLANAPAHGPPDWGVLFEYAAAHLAGKAVLVAHADIAFDATVSCAAALVAPPSAPASAPGPTTLALTRRPHARCVGASGGGHMSALPVDLCTGYGGDPIAKGVVGYDAFGFLSPPPPGVSETAAGLALNALGGDHVLLEAFANTSLVVDPCVHVRAAHVHCTRERAYDGRAEASLSTWDDVVAGRYSTAVRLAAPPFAETCAAPVPPGAARNADRALRRMAGGAPALLVSSPFSGAAAVRAALETEGAFGRTGSAEYNAELHADLSLRGEGQCANDVALVGAHRVPGFDASDVQGGLAPAMSRECGALLRQRRARPALLVRDPFRAVRDAHQYDVHGHRTASSPLEGPGASAEWRAAAVRKARAWAALARAWLPLVGDAAVLRFEDLEHGGAHAADAVEKALRHLFRPAAPGDAAILDRTVSGAREAALSSAFSAAAASAVPLAAQPEAWADAALVAAVVEAATPELLCRWGYAPPPPHTGLLRCPPALDAQIADAVAALSSGAALSPPADAPQANGRVAIFGCSDARYRERYEVVFASLAATSTAVAFDLYVLADDATAAAEAARVPRGAARYIAASRLGGAFGAGTADNRWPTQAYWWAAAPAIAARLGYATAVYVDGDVLFARGDPLAALVAAAHEAVAGACIVGVHESSLAVHIAAVATAGGRAASADATVRRTAEAFGLDHAALLSVNITNSGVLAFPNLQGGGCDPSQLWLDYVGAYQTLVANDLTPLGDQHVLGLLTAGGKWPLARLPHALNDRFGSNYAAVSETGGVLEFAWCRDAPPLSLERKSGSEDAPVLAHFTWQKPWDDGAEATADPARRVLVGEWRALQAALEEMRPRRVVSVSLYGDSDRYISGAVAMAREGGTVFPGWTVRVYHDRTVPDAALQAVRRAGQGQLVEFVDVSTDPRYAPAYADGRLANGRAWRFLVASDASVDAYAVRDVDTRLTRRDALAVEAWLASGRPLHVLRDHPSHTVYARAGYPIMAGMWGGNRHAAPEMAAWLLDEGFGAVNEGYLADAVVLAKKLWPKAQQRAGFVLQHDAFSCDEFGGGAPFPTAREGDEHIGAVVLDARGALREEDVGLLRAAIGRGEGRVCG